MLPAASGCDGEDVATVLESLRAENPDDPFWRGVAGTEVEAEGVRVRFREGIEPREREAGEARVLCHLFDEEALAAAARTRETARPAHP